MMPKRASASLTTFHVRVASLAAPWLTRERVRARKAGTSRSRHSRPIALSASVCVALLLVAGLCQASEPDQKQAAAAPPSTLERGFANPPAEGRLRAYWWWLNGNVTAEAITRDLEWMKRVGMGGALVFDAGGADQFGHAPVPAGPQYASPEWRTLLAHTVREAGRLGLTLSFNPQSGWNLGGPTVPVEEASKQLVWSTVDIHGPARLDRVLPAPPQKRDFYRDVAVLACPMPNVGRGPTPAAVISASSTEPGYPAARAGDAQIETYWCSAGSEPGGGPTADRPAWLELKFPAAVAVTGVAVLGRAGYSPRDCEFQASADGSHFRTLAQFAVDDGRITLRRFDSTREPYFRLVIRSAYDKGSPRPRNVQVAEIALLGPDGRDLLGPHPAMPIRQLDLKAGTREMGGSAPDGSILLDDDPAWPHEPHVNSADIVDLTDRLEPSGQLRWDVPAGDWRILRFGYTNNGANVSTFSGGWRGPVVDYLDPEALRAYWRRVVAPNLDAIGQRPGDALKALQTDSWELGGVNWTPRFADEFRRRRGYDVRPFLPIIAGILIDGRATSHRFLNDFRKTIGDCVAENHYGVLAELAHARGLAVHPESGGPHGGPFEALKCLGRNDFPMTEFWVPSPHRPGEDNRFFVKQASSAAHIYGKRFVAAEGFTSVGPQWNDLLWQAQKPSFDHEACAGLNLVFWHTFTCSPPSMGLPGQEYFAGTHFNPNITWARQAPAFVRYLNRSQYLLQQGRCVADVLYYYGDHVPNFVRLKKDDPAHVLPGYDYDVVNEEVLTSRLAVRDGRLVLPDGMDYRVLVLPNLEVMSLEAARALHRLVKAGATVIGPRPKHVTGLRDSPRSDDELKTLANDLWADCDGRTITDHRFGRGRVFWGKNARQVLAADGVGPDYAFATEDGKAVIDAIHRTDSDAEIYFVSNQRDRSETIDATFRITGRQPELWDAVTGTTRDAGAFRQSEGGTTVPLELAPYGAMFVVFRRPIATDVAGTAAGNFPHYSREFTLEGPWDVHFDPKWGGPESTAFPSLTSWTTRTEEGIRHYSGTATYRKTFDLPPSLRGAGPLALNVGEVRNIAEVRLNGKALGVVWCPPFRVAISDTVKAEGNVLEIDVVNSWYNRLLFDRTLPAEKRLTRTNIRLPADAKPEPSGLLGPVTIEKRE